MNRYPFISALAAVALLGPVLSCQQEPAARIPATVFVSVASGGDPTRTTSATDAQEDRINDLQVFIFGPGGERDGYGHRTGSGDLAVRTYTGVHDVWAVTNAPDLGAVATRDDLLSTVARLDAQTAGSFLHVGHAQADLAAGGTVQLSTEHLVSRCVLRKLTSRLPSGTLTLTDLFLTNVAGDGDFAASASPTLWYNRMGLQYELDRFLHDEITPSGGTLLPGDTYAQDHRFYMMPNLVEEDDRSSVWGPRRTRLVARAELDGETFFYPVSLPSGANNLSYVLSEMVVSRIGVQDPETEIPFTAITYDVDMEAFAGMEGEADFRSLGSSVVFCDPGTDPFSLLSSRIDLRTDRFLLVVSDGSVGPWDPVYRLAEGKLSGMDLAVFVGGIGSYEELSSLAGLHDHAAVAVSFGCDASSYEAIARLLSLSDSAQVRLLVTDPSVLDWEALASAIRCSPGERPPLTLLRVDAADYQTREQVERLRAQGIRVNVPFSGSVEALAEQARTLLLESRPCLFAGMQIAPAPLRFNGTSFEIGDRDWNHDSYGSAYGLTAGSYYFSHREIGAFFDSRGSSFADETGDIDNANTLRYRNLDGWRLPTVNDWSNILTNPSRSGSSVNGTAGCRLAMIRLTGVTHAGSDTPMGMLVLPDGEIFTGMSRTFGWNQFVLGDDTDVTPAQLGEYLGSGCVFLPASGYYVDGTGWWAGWYEGGAEGRYWSASRSGRSYGHDLYFYANFIHTADYLTMEDNYLPVRLVR